MRKYYKRLIEKEIDLCLRSTGAICISGPKFCGKTTTSKIFSKSSLELISSQALNIAAADLDYALNGQHPMLIDEWQVLPDIWNVVRKKVDDKNKSGMYILTGSATPINSDEILHSGAGRIAPITMETMSLQESEDSTGEVSLEKLFNDKNYRPFNQNPEHSIKDTAFVICRGGWPNSLDKNYDEALKTTEIYYQGLFNFRNFENRYYVRRNPETFRLILKSYARNISSEASYKTLLRDIRNNENKEISTKTFNAYTDMLKDLFILNDMEAWSVNLRSKATVRTTATRHFFDPSIACCALDIRPSDMLNDYETFGLMFEDLAVRDLRIYANYLGGNVKHYRDSNGLECDCVMHLKNGKWAAIEIKLGGTAQEDIAAKNLIKFSNLIDEKYEKPTFLMVLTANGPAYKRKDGVIVAPINLLGV